MLIIALFAHRKLSKLCYNKPTVQFWGETMEKLGSKLRKLRKENNLTLRELGDKLNLSFSILAMYERSERVPPVDKLKMIADFYNVTVDYLLTDKENSRNNKNTIKQGQLPVLNNIKEEPIISEENIICYQPYDRIRMNKNNYFYYLVKNKSMTGSRILPNDMALIKLKSSVNNGEIIVALVDGNTILRRYFYKKGKIILEPDNPDYEPLIYEPEKVKIIGKVIRVEFEVN